MTRGFRAALLLALAATCSPAAPPRSLAEVEAEPNHERRSRRAVAFAEGQLDAALGAYQAGEVARGRQALANIGSAVALAVDSLEATGKHPRRHPGPFKHAEIRTQRLLRELQEAQKSANIADVRDFDETIRQVEAANGKLLRGLMGPRG